MICWVRSAMRADPSDGSVSASSYAFVCSDCVPPRTAASASIVVRDHGIGIAPADQERVFERFERAVSASNFSGFGVGLWIVRRFVEAHGGQVRVDSKPGEGAMFSIELPLR